jgi:hypothetical protein
MGERIEEGAIRKMRIADVGGRREIVRLAGDDDGFCSERR